MVVPAKFDGVWNFYNNHGLAKVKLDDKYGFINLQGELVIPATFYDTSDFAVNGLAAVMVEKGVDKRANHQRKDAKWGYIDTKGKMVIKDKNLSATGFNDNGMAEVCFWGPWDKEYRYINSHATLFHIN